ncbi:Protein kinase domain [Macleaya cordata]|uniref:cyclin-dependent kinase n=1 Tax=Macleaya cordata TaxID=56857 RepID=A0A200Q4K5_MACCD|nr:Protein kinase domain [Macleaya cordata]
MNRYNIIREVGEGSFGSVCRAINKQTGEAVAIKRIKKKFDSWEECLNLREVKSLRKMNHPNIVKLREVIRENEILYFVFEYMECNLYELISEQANYFSEAEVRRWCFKIFQALLYMHRCGYFHRDLKPENLLVTKDVIKIADFGLAREICSQPPYTDYVSTRWYRAPEVLLKSPTYNSAVDMWAMGAIMAELFTLHPLFPGSSEVDQMYKICSVIGSPNQNSWPEGLQLANSINYQFPQLPGVHLSALVPYASEDAISLITSLCSWDPNKRPTAAEVLQHPFFRPCFYVPPSLRSKTPLAPLGITPPGFGTARTTMPLLEIDHQLANKNNNNALMKSCAKQTQPISRYQPVPSTNNAINMGGAQQTGVVSDAMTERLAQLKVGSGYKVVPPRQAAVAAAPPGFGTARTSKQAAAPPPRMKAGGWHGHTDGFLGRSPNEIVPSAARDHYYSIRKVVG